MSETFITESDVSDIASGIIVAVVLIAAFLFIVAWRDRGRRRSVRVETWGAPAIDEEDPCREFYQLCLIAGFRFLGDQMPLSVHGLSSKLAVLQADELLFARVPLRGHEFPAPGHALACAMCHGRVFDLYVTVPETLVYRGRYCAQMIARVCGACGRIQERHEDGPRPLAALTRNLRTYLLETGDAVTFLRNLPGRINALKAAS